jgi:hypothetical protein
MKLLPIAALSGAASLATIALTDALWRANLPNSPSVWSVEEGPDFMLRGVCLAHGIAYLLFAAVLVRGGRAIDGGRWLPRIVRWVLVVGYALFSTVYTSVGLLDPRDAPTGIVEVVTTVVFIITLLLPIVLGFTLVRRRDFRVPALFLLAPIVVFPLTLLLAAVSTWAHPAYLETVVNFGVALLGVAAFEVGSSTNTEITTAPSEKVKART